MHIEASIVLYRWTCLRTIFNRITQLLRSTAIGPSSKFIQPVFVIAVALTVPTEAANKFSDFPQLPIVDYALHSESDGIAIAVEAVRDKKDLKKYFRADMIKEGFLPIYIAIENTTRNSNFLFTKRNLEFVTSNNELAISTAQSSTLKNANVGRVSKIFMNPAAVLVSPIGFMIAGININKAMSFRHNLIKKELRSQTIAPQEIIRGFVLLPFDKKLRNQEVAMRIGLSMVGTSKIVKHDFIL